MTETLVTPNYLRWEKPLANGACRYYEIRLQHDFVTVLNRNRRGLQCINVPWAHKSVDRWINRQIARNAASQLITYSTGAPVSFGDRQALETILDGAEKDRYGLRTLIHQIVQSDLFTHK